MSFLLGCFGFFIASTFKGLETVEIRGLQICKDDQLDSIVQLVIVKIS